MSAHTISPQEYEEFRAFLEGACGIVLGENKKYLVTSRLNRVVAEYNLGSLSELIRLIKSDRSPDLRDRIIEAMTTNETSWFRDRTPYTALDQLILPDLARTRCDTLRIWSAACSSGQEPYSIGITVSEFQIANPGVLSSDVQIVATDISPAMLRVARSGCYDNLAMGRGMSPELKKRYFRPRGNRWEVIAPIRSKVQFRELNLLRSYALMGAFDVIFCRNVLIYFSTASKRDILERITPTLNPGGYLLLGGSESLAGVSDFFQMIRFGGGVIYKRKP